METRLLTNMIPLETNLMEVEFKDICEYIYVVTRCSAFDNKDISSWIKKGIQEVLRIFGHQFKPTRISEKAFEHYKSKMKEDLSDSNLYKKWYKERKQYYPLFLEHIVPLGSIIERCKKCNSINEIAVTLKELEFVIILQSEDDILKNKGYTSEGRETLEKAEKIYRECGILLRRIDV